MLKSYTNIIAAIMTVGAISCASAARAEEHASGVDRGADLLYRAKCAACHKVYSPANYTYEKLEAYVARYGKALSDVERARLLNYLKENSKQEQGVMD